MSNKIVQNEAGFSLIEILIALTIFAIGLLATAGMQITALQSNAGSHRLTSINAIASGVMEEILTWAPDDPRLVNVAGNPHAWDFDRSDTDIDPVTIEGGGTFTAEYTVTKDAPIANVSTIRLEVKPVGALTAWGVSTKVLTTIKKTK